MTNKQIDPRMTKARAALVTGQPFFGTLALYLQIVEDEAVETMGVDGTHLFYAPSFLDKVTPAELRGILVHEVLHCAFQHHTRRQSRDAVLWNEAADYVINPVVLQSGFQLPAGALLDDKYKGMGAEEVYSRLKANQPPPQPGQDGSSSPPRGKPQPGGNGPPAAQQGPKNDPGKAQQGPAGAGTPTGGPAKEGKPTPLGQAGKVMDAAPAHSPGAVQEAAAEWDRRVRQAINVAAAQNCGNVPGNLAGLVEAVKKPKVDWREQLRQFFDAKTRTDYSWVNPNKRMLGYGIIFPGVKPDGMGKLVMIVDTSGSVSNHVLGKMVDEIQSAMELGAVEELIVVQCDTKVTHVDHFHVGDDIKIEAHGRGGTRFAPAFQWVEENEPDAAAIIYLTDLECSDWGKEPGCPVMWVAYGFKSDVDQRKLRVPFGEIIFMED